MAKDDDDGDDAKVVGDITQSKERSRSVGRSVSSVCFSKMRTE